MTTETMGGAGEETHAGAGSGAGTPWRRGVRPRLRSADADGSERHATWFELFFDLVFVLVVAQLAGLLEGDPSPAGMLWFAALFVPMWWAWVVYTFYADRFDTDDAGHRLLYLLGMLALTAVAVALPHARGDGAPFFVGSYLVVRLVPLLLYLRAGRSVPLARRLSAIYGTGSAAAALLWVGALWVERPWRFALWAIAVLVEVGVPIATRRARGQVAAARLDAGHIAERFGLLTIIVLGESVVAVGSGLGTTGWDLATAAVAAGTFVVVAGMWWVYFAFSAAPLVGRGPNAQHVFVYGHLPIVVSVTAVAAGCRLAVEGAAHGEFPPVAGWALGGGVALFLLTLSVMRVLLEGRPERRRVARGAAGLVALAGAATQRQLGPGGLVALLAVLLTALVASEVREAGRRDTAALDSLGTGGTRGGRA